MHATTVKRGANYKAVLVAVYHLADEDGLCCHATNRRIAEAAGRGSMATAAALRDLVRRGVVAWLDWRDGLSHSAGGRPNFP